MGSYSVTCHLAAVTFPPLPYLKLVLGLATLEEFKAKLPVTHDRGIFGASYYVTLNHSEISSNLTLQCPADDAVPDQWLYEVLNR